MIEIFNIDCFQFMKTMVTDSVNLTLTDIPYNEVNRSSNGLRELDKNKADIFASSDDLDNLVDELVRVTSGSIYIFCGINQISFLRMRMQYHNLTGTRLCTWEKTNPSPMNGEHNWESGAEHCVFGKKPSGTFNAHCKNVVWKYSTDKSKKDENHPTPKPLKMFRMIIETSSNKNDIVFDPFMGSGTSGVAAKILNRQFIGCEIDPTFFSIAQGRMNHIREQDEMFIF